MENRTRSPARYEIKMVCQETYLPEIQSWIRLHPHCFVQAYPPRQVNNVYLDTFAVDDLNDHLSGVGERQKLRFRWYGHQDTEIQGILERKCKSGSLSWKEQCPIPRAFDLSQTTWTDWMAQVRASSDREARLWLSRSDRPTLLNRYWREYYVTFDGRIRLTVDSGMRVYDQTTHRRPNLDLYTPVEEEVVLELKCDPSCYRTLSDILRSLPLRVGRNSKYVTGMESLDSP
jgi:hypothetical protein